MPVTEEIDFFRVDFTGISPYSAPSPRREPVIV